MRFAQTKIPYRSECKIPQNYKVHPWCKCKMGEFKILCHTISTAV